MNCQICSFDKPVGGTQECYMNNGLPRQVCQLCANTKTFKAVVNEQPNADVLAAMAYMMNQVRKDLDQYSVFEVDE